MDFIIQYCWQVLRNIKHYMVTENNKSILCRLGIHNNHRGFGWSSGRRMDVCLRNNCNHSKWYDDKKGSDIISGK